MSDKWKKIFIITASVVMLLIFAALAAAKTVTVLNEDGYAVPGSSGIVNSLKNDKDTNVEMVELKPEEKVFASVLGWFVGDDRRSIDKLYPLYINSGTGLRFLNDYNWLIAPDLELLQSYEGLYLSNGITYTPDRQQADLSEFILLTLDNGLYINAEHAIFTNQLGSKDIPLNSIINFNEDYIRWYSYDRGFLGYDHEESVFDATITIGKHTYDYREFLKSLAIVDEAIEKLEHNEDADDIIDEALDFYEDPYVRKMLPIIAGEIIEEGSDTTIYSAQELSYITGSPVQTQQEEQKELFEYISDNEPTDEQDDEYVSTSVIPDYAENKKKNDYYNGWYEEDNERSSSGTASGGKITEIVLTAEKILKGRDIVDGEFSFYVEDASTGKRIRTAKNIAGSVTFDSIRISAEGDYNYIVKEEIGNLSSIEYSRETHSIHIVAVSKDNDVEISAISVDDKAVAVAGTINVGSYTNIYDPAFNPAYLKLKGTKSLDGKVPESEEFSFDLKNESEETLQTATNSEADIEFSRLAFNTPGNYKYYVSESEKTADTKQQESISGTTTLYDKTVHEIAVSIVKNGKDCTIDRISVDGIETATSSEINFGSFKNEQYKIGRLLITAKKKLEGRDLTTKDKFYFEMNQIKTDEEGEKTSKMIASAVNSGSSVKFPKLEYTEAGHYEYTIEERLGTADHIIYSRDKHTVSVDVEKDVQEKKFKITSIKVDGESVAVSDSISVGTFTNVYDTESQPASLTLTGTKKLINGDVNSAKFGFVLKNRTGTVETVNNAGSVITFSKLCFNTPGEYNYTISEEKEADPNLVTDSTVYSVYIKVGKGTSGCRIEEIKIDDKAAAVDDDRNCTLNFGTFTNQYYTIPKVSIVAEKILNGGKLLKSGDFEFTLKEDGNLIEKVANKGKDVKFTPIEYKEEGTHTYTVAEVLGTASEIKYDERVYVLTVDVEKSGSEYRIAGMELDGEQITPKNIVKVGVFTNEGPQITPSTPSEPGGGGEEEEPTGPVETEYVDPVVYTYDDKEWTYAVCAQLDVTDPSDALYKGVSFTVYSDIESKESPVIIDGRKCYKKDSSKGGTTLLRKKYYGSQFIALSILPPDTDVYVQYEYSYIKETVTKDSEGKDVIVQSKETETSDIWQYHTCTIKEGDIKTVNADWKEIFAYSESSAKLEDVFLTNTSGYIPENVNDNYELTGEYVYIEDEYANFILNTLPYINKVILTARAVDSQGAESGDSIELTIGSSYVNQAIKDGTVWISNSVLQSNTRYRYTAKLVDKYGNELPVEMGSGYSGYLYTRKKSPVVAIEEKENTVNGVTLEITVNDDERSIDSSIPLKLKVLDSQKKEYLIYGELDGEKISQSAAKQYVELEHPEAGKKYTLKIDSLKFGENFSISVDGTYDPTPDDSGSMHLDKVAKTMGSLKIFTASLETGSIQFTLDVTNREHTSADLEFTMNKLSTSEYTGMIDQMELVLKGKKTGAVVDNAEVVLREEDLQENIYQIEFDKDNRYVIDEGTPVKPKIEVELTGTKLETEAMTLWDALMIHYDSDNDSWSTPLKLIIELPEGMLVQGTEYYAYMQPYVNKAGAEGTIKQAVRSFSNPDTFTTKKTPPVVSWDEFFCLGSNAKLQGLKILDASSTILDKECQVSLYYPEYSEDYPIANYSVLASETAGEGTTLEFSSLVPGKQYRIEIRALKYNDDTGLSYENNVLLTEPLIFIAGSSVDSTFSLESLTYTDGGTAGVLFDGLTKTSEEIDKLVADGVWTRDSKNLYTGFIPVDDNISFIRIPDFSYDFWSYYYMLIDYFDENKKQIGAEELHRLDWSPDMVFTVPQGTAYIKCKFPVAFNPDIEAYYYSTRQSNLFSSEGAILAGAEGFYSVGDSQHPGSYINDNGKKVEGNYNMLHMFPVEEGDLYTNTFRGRTTADVQMRVAYWTEDKTYMGQYTVSINSPITVPQGAGYMSVYVPNNTSYNALHQLHKIGSVDTSKGLTSIIDVEMKCNPDYFKDEKWPYVILYSSDSVREPVYAQYDKVTLKYAGDDRWIIPDAEVLQDGSTRWIHKGLSGEKGWLAELHMIYNDEDTVVAELSFQTDGDYNIIRNNLDFRKITSNPFGNFVVVEDIDYSLGITPTIYGTVDFQGHKLIKNVDSYFFKTIYPSANVKNLVVEIPDGKSYRYGIFENNYGNIENLVWRTVGESGRITWSNVGDGIFGYNNYGVISNFTMELGGDFIVHRATSYNPNYDSILLSFNYGTIENGYIYALTKPNGEKAAWIIGEPQPEGTGYAKFDPSFICGQYGILRNMYMLTDFYYIKDTENIGYQYIFPTGDIRGTYEGFYLVGDFYNLDSDGNRTNQLLDLVYDSKTGEKRTYDRLVNESDTSIKSSLKNIWHITQKTYDMACQSVDRASFTILRDSDWQEKLLGDAFDVKNTISKGFYPRIDLPEYMSSYQPYIDLPATEIYGAPAIMSDSWADGSDEAIHNTWGNVKFRFRNNMHYPIQSISITGLTVEIQHQGIADDGLWDVIAKVSVDESDLANLRYASTYELKSFTYGPSGTTGTRQSTDYNTSGFDFWYEVRTTRDWLKIDSSTECMTWNYRLMNDISFSGESADTIRVSINSNVDKDYFTGKIDGQGYTLSDIDMSKSQLIPGVIARISGAEIMNIVVDGMKLNCSAAVESNRGYTGFISYADNSKIDNVHVINSEISGVRYIGSVVGYTQNSRITDCSSRYTKLDDHKSMNTLYMGGIAAYAGSCIVSSCYTRGMEITADESYKEYASGGLVGYVTNTYTTNCYAQGSMYVEGNYVGGIIGRTDSGTLGSMTSNCWSGVDIESLGSYVGGISGQRGLMATGNFAFGNIISDGNNVHRMFGNDAASFATNQNNCAYVNQLVSGLEDNEADDAYRIFSGEELEKRYVWADIMGFGSRWQLSDISEGICPRVLKYDDSGELVPGQDTDPVTLPGAGGEHKLSVMHADYYSSNNTYSVTLRWIHPGYTTAELQALFSYEKNNTPGASVSIDINGLDCSYDAYQKEESFIVQWSESSVLNNCTYLTINNKIRKYILDDYKVTISYKSNDEKPKDISLVQMAQYTGAPQFNEVPNYEVWKTLMDEGHGTTGENFKITGNVDFDGKDSQWKGLKIGRLVGQSSTEYPNPGFYNMNYSGASSAGEPVSWIESVSTMDGLTFADINVDMSTDVTESAYGGTFVLFADEVNDVNLNGIVILTNDYTASYSGFFRTISSTLCGLNVNGLYLTRGSGTTAKNYVGGVAVEVFDGFKDVYLQNIEIDVPDNYVGGFITDITDNYGYRYVSEGQGLDKPTFDGVTTQGTMITSLNSVAQTSQADGRKVTYSIGGQTYEKVLKGYTVEGNKYVGGAFYHTLNMINIVADGINVSGYTDVGGLFYNSSYRYSPMHIVVKNSTIKGNGTVGGIFGNGTSMYGFDMSVIGCTVDIRDEGLTTMDGTTCGGIAGTAMPNGYSTGYVSVRDTLVRGYGYVGGAVGMTGNTIYSAYIAEDVTVISLRGWAGGGIGYTSCYSCNYGISDYNVGATVISYTKGAGGIIGYAGQGIVISQCYCNAKVTGATYVGGLMGWNNSTSYYSWSNPAYQPLKPSRTKNVIIAGTFTVTNRDGKASVWANFSRDNEYDEESQSYVKQDCAIKVWDQTVVNGSVVNAGMMPDSGTLVSSELLRRVSTYTDLGFTTSNYDFSYLDRYMPFRKYNGSIMRYTHEDLKGNSVGIPLPEYGVNPDQVYVYPSGPDTLNIEVGRTSVYEPSIPGDYFQQVEYLHSTGTQYINTEVTADGNTGFYIEAVENDLRQYWHRGNLGENDSGAELFLSAGYTRNGYNGIFIYGSESVNLGGAIQKGEKFFLTFDPGDTENKAKLLSGKENEADKQTIAELSHQDFVSSSGIKVFNGNGYPSTMDIYRFKIIKDGKVIRDYYPVYRKSDGKPGLYDILNGYFCTNSGSGEFTVGEDVTAASGSLGTSYEPYANPVTVSIGGGASHTYNSSDFSDGVLTIGYDYKNDVTVTPQGGTSVTYKADDLRRTLALTGDGYDAATGNYSYYLRQGTDGTNKLVSGKVDSYTTDLPESVADLYVPVEYIDIPNKAYIDLDLKCQQDSVIEFDFAPMTGGSNTYYFFGSHSNTAGANGIALGRSGSKWYVGGGCPFMSGGTFKTEKVHVKVQKNQFQIGSDLLTSTHASAYIGTDGYTLALGAMKYKGAVQNSTVTTRWYNYKQQDTDNNGNLITVRDMIPVYRKSDLVAGLLDISYPDDPVFYTNAGTGTITYGPGVTETVYTETEVDLGSENPIHIWNAVITENDAEKTVLRVLTDQGHIYNVVHGSKEDGYDTATTNLVAKSPAHGFWKGQLAIPPNTSAMTVENYRNYTLIGTNRFDYRVFYKSNIKKIVSPYEDVVPDAVILNKCSGIGLTASLSTEGRLRANFTVNGLEVTGIKEISNSLYGSEPIMLVRYNDDSVMVVNYDRNLILKEEKAPAVAAMSFASYVFSSAKKMLSSAAYSDEGVDDGLTGTSDEEGTVMDGSLSTLSFTPIVTAVPLESGTAAASAQTVSLPGTAMLAGTGNASGTASNEGNALKEGEASGGGTAAATETISSENSDSAAATANEEKTASENAVSIEKDSNGNTVAMAEGTDIPLASAVYVKDAGLFDIDGNAINEESSINYVEGEGLYVNGELEYVESLLASPEVSMAVADNIAEGLTDTDTEQTDGSAEDLTDTAESGDGSELEEGADGYTEAGEPVINAGGTADESGTQEADGSASGNGNMEADGSGMGNGQSEAAGSALGTGTSGTAGINTREVLSTSDADRLADNSVLLVSPEEAGKQIAMLFGDEISLYDPVAGEYVTVDSEVMADASINNKAQPKEKAETEEEEETVTEEEKSRFKVSDFGKSLTGTEKQGMGLIWLAGAAIVGLFVTLYFGVIRKKRRGRQSDKKKIADTGDDRDEQN